MKTKAITRMTAFGLIAAAALSGVIFLMSDSVQAQVVTPGATIVSPVFNRPVLPIVAPRPILAPRPFIVPRPFFNPFFPRFFPFFGRIPFLGLNPFIIEENPFLFDEEIGVGLGEVD